MNAGLGLRVISPDRGPKPSRETADCEQKAPRLADAFPDPALAPAARGRSVDSSRNGPFNLGALGELLTCHWHPLILKRKNPATKGPLGGSAGGVAALLPLSRPAPLRGVKLPSAPGPALDPPVVRPAYPDCSASFREPMGSSRPPAWLQITTRKC